MRKIMYIMAASVLVLQISTAQFKQRSSDQPKIADSFIHQETSSNVLSFFNPANFEMHHSYSMSYMSGGGQGLALGSYTNMMMYKFSDQVDARVAVSMQHSPYSTFNSTLQNSLSGVFFDGAEINYRPSKNMLLRVSYQQVPWNRYGYFGGYNGMFSQRGGMYSGFDYNEGN